MNGEIEEGVSKYQRKTRTRWRPLRARRASLPARTPALYRRAMAARAPRASLSRIGGGSA
jgi:hypothetical protein